jgi:fructoselysine-6-P-deglycase FrlB-like protein
MLSRRDDILNEFSARAPKRIVVIGSGSSLSIGKSAQLSALLAAHVDAVAIAAGDLMCRMDYYAPILKGATILALSRSGETDEIVNATRRAKETVACRAVGICCKSGSRLSKLADLSLELPWAFDKSVCQTRSVANLHAAAQILWAIVGNNPETLRELDEISGRGEAFLKEIEPPLRQFAKSKWQSGFVLADGEAAGIAEEASLALTEIANISTKFSNVLDVRHGPMLLLKPDAMALVHVTGEGFAHQKRLVGDVVKKGSGVIAFSDLPIEPLEGVKCQICFGSRLSPAAAGIPLLLIAQLVAYHSAIEAGLDPDRPDGLDACISLSDAM